jgi:hypothetical protein
MCKHNDAAGWEQSIHETGHLRSERMATLAVMGELSTRLIRAVNGWHLTAILYAA